MFKAWGDALAELPGCVRDALAADGPEEEATPDEAPLPADGLEAEAALVRMRSRLAGRGRSRP